MMMQTLIALAIVLGAAAWLVRRSLRRPVKASAKGCSGCGSGGACGTCPVQKGDTPTY
jgi:hypothetical protein